MNKLLAILLSLTMALTLCAGCAAETTEEAANPVSNEVIGTTTATEPEQPAVDELVAEDSQAEENEASDDIRGDGIRGNGNGPNDDDGPSGDVDGSMSGNAEPSYPEAVALFTQHKFTDEETGLTVPYNLYLPEGYNEEEAYPLMIFVADSSVNSNEVTDPLNQDGAAVWATAGEQEKHPCIVLVPQYTEDLVNEAGMLTTDEHVWNDGLTMMKNLFDYIIETYSVDENRIYGTGQSQGGMMTIAISNKYPDFYTAQYLVACQWDAEEMAAMADDKLWITVCEGDFKAYPGMNASVAVWEEMGVPVVKNEEMWDSAASAEELDALVADIATQEGDIHYTVFAEGNHMGTWKFAYDIEAVRDWIFAQTK